MPDEPDGLYDEEGRTPSQAALDQQGEGDQVANALRFQGAIAEARRQIQNRIARGGSKAHGRELLGEIDELAQSGDPDTATRLTQSMDQFIHGGAGVAPASQPAAKQAAGARQAAPRPATAASRARDRQRQLDPNTPTSELREIRARQKAAGE